MHTTLKWLLLLLLWAPSNLPGQAVDQERGAPFITNYSVKDYQGLQQNWAIVQDSRGLMYFGNQGAGVLQFDGVSWRQIAVPNGLVRALAIDSEDRILVGGHNEFGYLTPDSIGRLTYVSLLSLLDESQHELQQVMNIHPTATGVFFQARNRLLFWQDGDVQSWEPETVFNRSFMVDGKLYVTQLNIGLMLFQDGVLKLAPGGEQFKNEKIFSMLPLDGGRFIVGTLSGLFLYEGAEVSPFHSDAGDLLVNIVHGVPLTDGTLAYATLESGIVVIDRTGKTRRIINRSTGLRDNSVIHLAVDRTGALWATLNSGIARIDYPGPFTFYTDEQTPMINVYAAARSRGRLYAGTIQGLFELKQRQLQKGENTTSLRYAAFEAIPQVQAECFALLSFGESLLLGTPKGIFDFDGQGVHLIVDYQQSPVALYRSKTDSQRVFAGLDDGLLSLRRTAGVWRDEGKIADLSGYANTLLEDEDGSLWVGSYYSGLRRVDLSRGPANASVQSFGEKDGLPTGPDVGWINVFLVGGRPLFATMRGLYRFDKSLERFHPEPSFGDQLADGSHKIWACSEDRRGNVYFNVAGKQGDVLALAKRLPDGEYDYTELPFRTLTQQSSGLIYPDADGSVWLGTDEAFINYDPHVPKDYQAGFSTLIRRVLVRGDSVVFGGAVLNPGPATNEHAGEGADNPAPAFDYQDNSLRFEFAATSYERVTANRFQFLLEGSDDTWSNWTRETRKDYTHLPPGDYVFRVRGRNVYDRMSDEASYAFAILPPWYQTWQANLAWVFLFTSSLIALVKLWELRTLKIERARAEQREQIRREMAADFHDGAGDKLAQISLFSKFVQGKMKDKSQETLTALKWIVEAADALKLETRDFIWALDTEHDTLWDVADRIADHGKALFRRAQPEVAFAAYGVAEDLRTVPVTLDWKRNLIFIFKEALNNAFKYSSATSVELHFAFDDGVVTVRLTDTGAGFNPDAAFDSKGLRNMRRRAEKVGAELTIDSAPGRGTTVLLKGRLK